MKTVSFALAGLAILASVATAQKQVPVQQIKGAKSFQIGTAQPKSTSAVVYSNTLSTGYYSVPGLGEEWLDWGSARDLTPLAEHGTVTGGTFNYATSAITGPIVRWRTYDGYTGGCVSLSPGGLDVSVSGLPGTIFTSGATGWTIGINLAGAGACFYLPTGPFGYSMTFNDTMSGPSLMSGDSAENRFDWVLASTGSCSPSYWFGGVPWAGFGTEFIGWKASDSAGLGANGPISLSITGNSCPGGTLTISVASAPPAAFSAVGVGIVVGAGIGGPLPGGVAWDVGLAPGVAPISVILGLFPGTISFDVTSGAASGAVFGLQWVQKVGPVVSTSNVAMLYAY